MAKDLLAAKQVDDINMAGTANNIDDYVKKVERVFGTCKLNKNTYINCALRCSMDSDGGVTMDQDEYIKQLRPISQPDLVGANPEHKASNIVTDVFVSLLGALAYAIPTQFWIMMYVVSLQGIQEPTNIRVRRLNAITRKFLESQKKIIFQAMTPDGRVGLHSDTGYSKLTGEEDDETKGYGLRGCSLLRRGNTTSRKTVVHCICKPHRLQVRSSYAAEALAAAHS
eukprot:351721-Pyramimonas_sp.AAC.1